jgi:DNA mismatch endonuclease (patch repair protein)
MKGQSIRARAPAASSPAVRLRMQATPRRDTLPEVRLRSALHAAGLKFRLNLAPLPGLRCTADFLFPRQRVCVFVDGCFWHRCPTHFICPKTNASWWIAKLQATVERDVRQRACLRAAGWRVIRVWEHEVQSPKLIVSRVKRTLARRGLGTDGRAARVGKA